MRDIDKTKEELVSELTRLRMRTEGATGSLLINENDPAKLRQVIDELPQMVYEIGADGIVTYANRQTANHFGYSTGDFMRGLQASTIFHPDDLKRAMGNIRRIMSGEPLIGQEYRLLGKDGSSFPVKVFSQPVISDGRPVGIRGTIVDISESKRAEEALRSSENHYRTLFNNTGTAMAIFGDDSIITSCNDQFTILSGCSKEEVEGKLKWSDFVAPESMKMISGFHKTRTQGETGAPVDYEFAFLTKDGQRRTVHVYIQVIPDTKIRVSSLIDVTARKQAEQALRRSEERYQLVVRGANDGIWDWDLESDTVYYSPRYKAILGYEDHEFPNTAESWKSHVHPEDLDYVINANLECIRGKGDHFEIEYRMRHKDGSWRWILGRGANAANDEGKVYRLAGTHTDITARKFQERTTNALFAISKTVSTSTDLQHLYRNIHAILGEVIDATNFFICLYDSESDSATLTYWEDETDTYGVIEKVSDPETRSPTAQILRTGKPLFLTKQSPESIREWERIGSIGTIAASWIGVPLKIGDTIIGTMTVQHYRDPYRYTVNDVSLMEAASEQVALAIQKKRGEEALTRLNEELESKVEERTAEINKRTRELEAANVRLTELDRMKSALVSSISHELRTPLTSIRGFAKLTGKDFKRFYLPLSETPTLEKKGRRIITNLDIIESEGLRLTRLINDFLDINRIESGKATWNDVSFDPVEVIDKAVHALSGVFADKPGVRLLSHLPKAASPVFADPDKIQQVVINLLGNAAKFTSKGSVTVFLKEGSDTITVSVADTGQGVLPEEKENIFEKFHKSRTGDTILKSDMGTGLGLAISKEIITHYGGSIWVESTPGQGSTFSFSLRTARK